MINLTPKDASKGHTKTLPEYPFQKPRQTAAKRTRFLPYQKYMFIVSTATAYVVPETHRRAGHGQARRLVCSRFDRRAVG
jgi:hypothetical protein